MVIRTADQEQTRRLGARIGRRLRGFDMICLHGDLGSGKTTFAQGLAKGAGFSGRVTSPTFVLAKVYKAKRLKIFHLDLYRVSEGGAGDIGVEEFVSDKDGVCVAEWPRAGAAFYPKDHLDIRFSLGRRDGERRLLLSAHGPRSRRLLKGL